MHVRMCIHMHLFMILFMRGEEGETERSHPPIHSQDIAIARTMPGQSQEQELILGLPHGWQRSCSAITFCVPRCTHVNKKTESKSGTGCRSGAL